MTSAGKNWKVKIDKHQSILFNNFAFDVVEGDCYKLIFQVAIAHDKGKLAARQGRKAVSLYRGCGASARVVERDCLVAEGDRRKPELQSTADVFEQPLRAAESLLTIFTVEESAAATSLRICNSDWNHSIRPLSRVGASASSFLHSFIPASIRA